jgi:serine protease Do
VINSVQRLNVGDTATLGLIRNSKKVDVKVKVAKQPHEAPVVRRSRRMKSYDGQKAPFDLGFKISDYSDSLAEAFHIPPLRRGQPVVIEVDEGSSAAKAGLSPGDVILDVNKIPVYKARDVLKNLKKGVSNLIRVLKQDRVVILYLRA